MHICMPAIGTRHASHTREASTPSSNWLELVARLTPHKATMQLPSWESALYKYNLLCCAMSPYDCLRTIDYSSCSLDIRAHPADATVIVLVPNNIQHESDAESRSSSWRQIAPV